MNAQALRPYFLFALIAVTLAISFFVFRPFLVVLALAAIFASVLQPLYRRVLGVVSRSPGLAAFLTMFAAVVCILIPLSFISTQVTSDAHGLYASLSDGGGREGLNSAIRRANDVAARYAPRLALSNAELSASVDQYLKDALAWFVQNLGGAFGSVARALLDLFVFMIALYYFLRDGSRLKRTIVEMSPLADAEDTVIFDRLELAIRSVIRGSLAIALTQGVLTSIGFAIFGVPNAALWGSVAAFAALIPGVGTSLVLGPAIAYLFLAGTVPSALGLLAWSVFAVGLIDNFLGPRLVGRGMQLHPLLVLLSVFGGLAFFGPAGIFLGPLCTNLLFALLSIYQHLSRQRA